MHEDVDAKGLAAARRRAQWDLGDPDWADVIIDAYMSPDDSDAALREDGFDDA